MPTFKLNNDLSPTTQSVTPEQSELAARSAKNWATANLSKSTNQLSSSESLPKSTNAENLSKSTNQLFNVVDQLASLSLKDDGRTNNLVGENSEGESPEEE